MTAEQSVPQTAQQSIPLTRLFVTQPNATNVAHKPTTLTPMTMPNTAPTLTPTGTSLVNVNSNSEVPLPNFHIPKISDKDARHEISVEVVPGVYSLIPQCIHSGCFYYNIGDTIRFRLWNRGPRTLYYALFFVSTKNNVCLLPIHRGSGGDTAEEASLPRVYKTSISSQDFGSFEKDEERAIFMHTKELPDCDSEGKTKVIVVTTAADPTSVDILSRIESLGYASHSSQRLVKGDGVVFIENYVFFSSLDDYMAR